MMGDLLGLFENYEGLLGINVILKGLLPIFII